MTILFTAAKNGKGDLYNKIIEEIKGLGHNVRTRELLNTKLSSDNSKSKSKFKRELEIADLMVAEVSEVSISLGLEIATALDKGKHVLVLCSSTKSLDDLSDFVRENSSRYIHVCTYNQKNLGEVLNDSLSKIRKQLNYVLYVELPNKYGDIIGILSTREANAQGVTFAIKSQEIVQALQSWQEKDTSAISVSTLRSNRNLKGVNREEQLNSLRQYVFNVKAYN